MKIKKFMSIMIVMVVLIGSTWLSSFAKDSIAAITSPMSEPVASRVTSGDHDVLTVYYVVQWNSSYSSLSRYTLYEMVCDVPTGSNLTFRIGRQNVGLYSFDGGINPYIVRIYNIESGVLLGESSRNYTPATWNNNKALYQFVSSYFPENNASADICAGGYPIVPSGVAISGDTSSVYNSNPFVTWSVNPPEVAIYNSKLSEPEWDRYNRYFILNDKLYWVSLRLNGFYVAKSFIENRHDNLDYQVYNPDSHASIVLNYETYWAVDTVSGLLADYLPFSICVIPFASDDFRLMLKMEDFMSDLVDFAVAPYYLEADFYISSFNLEDGAYIESSFQEYNNTITDSQYLNFSFTDEVDSIKCYGVQFYNNLNIPVNLSQIKWNYDISWVRWRNAVQIYLSDIYSLLSNAPEDGVDAPTYPAYGDDINDSEPQYSDVAAEDVQQQLDEAVEGVDSYGDAAGQVKTWINDFIPPKILTVIIFALAFGVVILILGKNKDD